MERLNLHEFHESIGARFLEVNTFEVVADYGREDTEQVALRESAGFLDLSFRSRLCITGQDRVRFLHGQITNDVKSLTEGEGCYAALITAKGKMQSDLSVFRLADELLLDFEPGLAMTVSERLQKYVIADDVQVVDVAPLYGLLSVQGPKAQEMVQALGFACGLPTRPFQFSKIIDSNLGELYLVNRSRLGTTGYDLFVPLAALRRMAESMLNAVKSVGGITCGWRAFETVRVEAGIPRFGLDMDESNIPLEAGLGERAISFSKGCYIGQEVISRIHTYGQVAKALRGLRLGGDSSSLPSKGDKLFHGDKDVGYITSAIYSSAYQSKLALGYVRKEVNQIGTELVMATAQGKVPTRIVSLPFTAPQIETQACDGSDREG